MVNFISITVTAVRSFTDKSGKTFNMNGSYRGGGGRWFTDNNKLGGKKSDDGFLWTSGFTARMNEDGTNVEIVGHGYRNSYEQSVNSFGDMFQNDNDDHSSCRNSYILEYGSAGYFTRDGQRTYQRRPREKIQSAHWRQKILEHLMPAMSMVLALLREISFMKMVF